MLTTFIVCCITVKIETARDGCAGVDRVRLAPHGVTHIHNALPVSNVHTDSPCDPNDVCEMQIKIYVAFFLSMSWFRPPPGRILPTLV